MFLTESDGLLYILSTPDMCLFSMTQLFCFYANTVMIPADKESSNDKAK